MERKIAAEMLRNRLLEVREVSHVITKKITQELQSQSKDIKRMIIIRENYHHIYYGKMLFHLPNSGLLPRSGQETLQGPWADLSENHVVFFGCGSCP